MNKRKHSNKSMKLKKTSKKNAESNKFQRKIEDLPTFKYNEEIASDVLGSYTGIAEDNYEKPVQDADDL